MITVSFGVSSDRVEKPLEECPTGQSIIDNAGLLGMLGAPSNVEPHVNHVVTLGALPDGCHVALVTRANSKG